MENNHDTSKQEILGAINKFANSVEIRFDEVDKKFDAIDKRFDAIDKRFDEMEQRFSKVDDNMVQMKLDMVTKDYLDEKLFDLKGDIMLVIRKQDDKLKELAGILKEKGTITKQDFERVFSMPPFGQIFV